MKQLTFVILVYVIGIIGGTGLGVGISAKWLFRTTTFYEVGKQIEPSDSEETYWACRNKEFKLECVDMGGFLRSFSETSAHTESI